MPSSKSRPAKLLDGAAPIARGLWCWPALFAGGAVVLDAVWPLMPGGGTRGVLWLDLAAVGCLAWALIGPRRANLRSWATPIDGRILSGLALAVLHVVRLGGAIEPVLWLRQITSAGVCYYALSAGLRREASAPDAVWPVFALVLLALSGYSLGYAAQGTAALAAASRTLDLHWASQFGLAKTLMLVTLLCMGRAFESDASALWRAGALTGVLASIVCTVTLGSGLSVSSLASLDEPFYFGTSIVAFMLLASLSRMAWMLSRERTEQAGRWRAATLMFPLIAGLLLFGGTTGGEGVRAIAALAAAAVIAARAAPRGAVSRPGRPQASEPPLALAA